MTILTVIQNVSDELNLPFPSSVINNTNKTVRQLLSFANASGKRMSRRYDFEILIKEFTYTTVANENQGSLATVFGSDYLRLEGNSIWNRSTTRKVLGPYSPQEWQREKGNITTSIWDAFMLRGGDVFITPTPAAGEILAGEYVSKEWVLGADEVTTREVFLTDTDCSLIDEDLLTLDVKWRWLRAHGFSYSEEKLEFENEFSQMTGADKSSRVISLNNVNFGSTLDSFNTPDGGFGQ